MFLRIVESEYPDTVIQTNRVLAIRLSQFDRFNEAVPIKDWKFDAIVQVYIYFVNEAELAFNVTDEKTIKQIRFNLPESFEEIIHEDEHIFFLNLDNVDLLIYTGELLFSASKTPPRFHNSAKFYEKGEKVKLKPTERIKQIIYGTAIEHEGEVNEL